jgi:hypothetical protein
MLRHRATHELFEGGLVFLVCNQCADEYRSIGEEPSELVDGQTAERADIMALLAEVRRLHAIVDASSGQDPTAGRKGGPTGGSTTRAPRISDAKAICAALGSRSAIVLTFGAGRLAGVSYGETVAECKSTAKTLDAIVDAIMDRSIPSPKVR